ncbi:ArgS-related anticodon-binding protein NrtL [Streptomyces sp. NPDC048521]|uniref:ArgS-related anticodon-binding protein NrtL n=1 Tax=Streptomyces sp. NPDC048521 TaxID=3365566 RepID=UPI00371D07D9
MTPVELSRTVLRAVRCAVDDGELSVTVPERAVVTEPGPGGCGDYATNIALQLARPAGQPPRRVAEILRPRLVGADGIRDVVVTGPGFLNISLDAQTDLVGDLVREIRTRGAAYGHGDALAGQVIALRVPYEVRAEVVADAVVRIVATQGGRATVEHGEPVNLRPVPAPEDPAPLGLDAAQWALLHPAPHDRPRITADHLVQRESNPLFRVRYAHARIRSLSRNAARLGFTAEPGPVALGETRMPAAAQINMPGGAHIDMSAGAQINTGIDGVKSHTGAAPVHTDADDNPDAHRPDADAAVTAPTPRPDTDNPHPPTPHSTADILRPLLAPLADHPRILAVAATHRAPDRLARHLVTVADAVLAFLPCVLPRGEEKPSAAHRARLALAEAAGTVLAGGLSLLGIDAPEHL